MLDFQGHGISATVFHVQNLFKHFNNVNTTSAKYCITTGTILVCFHSKIRLLWDERLGMTKQRSRSVSSWLFERTMVTTAEDIHSQIGRFTVWSHVYQHSFNTLGPKRIMPIYFDDPLTFPLVLPFDVSRIKLNIKTDSGKIATKFG